MKRVLAILVAATVPAVAQPVTRPECSVTIVSAPADVREVVERWVAGEARCNTELEVRIIPTDGGLSLFARDASGRVRERLVPDAQSAGVLVASWMADDSVVRPPVEGVTPVVFVVKAPVPRREALVESETAPPVSSHWEGVLGVGVVGVGNTNQSGLRAELDLVTIGRVTIGLAGQATHFNADSAAEMYPYQGQLFEGNDYRMAVYAAHTLRSGVAWLRATLGVGMIHTHELVQYENEVSDHEGDSPYGEVSLAVGLDLGSRWAVSAGLVAAAFKQEWPLDGSLGSYFMGHEVTREGDYAGYVGVRCRL